MPITGVERSFYILSGAATPPYYTEAALYLLTPLFQVGDLALVWEALQLPLTGFLLLVIGAFLKNLIYTRSSVDDWKTAFERERTREREATEKAHAVEIAAIMAAHERERAAFQARFEIMEKSYLARLEEKDRHQSDSDKQVQVLIKLVQEGTLMLGQAAALVGNNQKTT